MKCQSNYLYNSVVLMGPVRIGKNAVANLLSKNTGIAICHQPTFGLKDKQEMIIKNPDYDLNTINEDFVINSIQSTESKHIEFIRNLIRSHKNKVILDTYGTFGVFEDSKNLDEAIKYLRMFRNRFLLLPSPDIAESIKILEDKINTSSYGKNISKEVLQKLRFMANTCNKYLLSSGQYLEYNPQVIYINDRAPLAVANEIKKKILTK